MVREGPWFRQAVISSLPNKFRTVCVVEDHIALFYKPFVPINF
jgi:hypothetical protein